MAGRGIFVNNNGTWQSVSAPYVNTAPGQPASVRTGWTKRNGQWQQFWPPNVFANVIVVGGGGGGGVGYGWEGGGGGGAGGVVMQNNVELTVGQPHYVIVGAGGGANAGGQDSYFGTTAQPSVSNGVDIPVYAGTYPVYNGFLNTYGVWTSQDFVSPVGSWVTVNYTVNIATSGNYSITASADNHIRLYVDGVYRVGNDNWGNTNGTGGFFISAGLHTITTEALNDGGPALFAAAMYDQYSNVVWHTRMTAPIITGNPLLAIGGGNGGWGTPSQTVGSGGSGGGGCGYVNTHGGGSSVSGQGNNGGTGIWQGYGAAGGGGGGGYASPGGQSNGNTGGDGGTGLMVTQGGLTFQLAGGGAGGWGNQGGGGTGPGGNANCGGGAGNGGNGQDGTGGGGGGSMHSAYSNAGTGGSGTVIVQYQAFSAFFTGGTVSVNDGWVTHRFSTPGSWSLTA
jgi:hypothetical protein